MIPLVPHWIVLFKRGRALSFLPSIVSVVALWLSSVPPCIFLCVTSLIAHCSKSIALQVETLHPVCTPSGGELKMHSTLQCTMHNAQCTGERRGRPTRSRTNEQRALITWCTTHHSHHSLSWLMCPHQYSSPTIWMYSTLNKLNIFNILVMRNNVQYVLVVTT